MTDTVLWTWKEIDGNKARRAKAVKLQSVLSSPDPKAEAVSKSTGEVYDVSLNSCTCKDFAIHHGHEPCKHMVALAMRLSILNENGLTLPQQSKIDLENLRDEIAIAYGYYYVFHKQLYSNQEYDSLKKKYAELSGIPLQPSIDVEDASSSAESAPPKTASAQAEQPDVLHVEANGEVFELSELTSLLRKDKIAYQDKTQSGGCFWMEDVPRSRKYAGFTVNGMCFCYAKSARAFKGGPGWYLSKSQEKGK